MQGYPGLSFLWCSWSMISLSLFKTLKPMKWPVLKFGVVMLSGLLRTVSCIELLNWDICVIFKMWCSAIFICIHDRWYFQVSRCNFEARPAKNFGLTTHELCDPTNFGERNSGSLHHPQGIDGILEHCWPGVAYFFNLIYKYSLIFGRLSLIITLFLNQVCLKSSAADVIQQLSGPLLVRMVHSKEGSRIAMLCIKHGSAKVCCNWYWLCLIQEKLVFLTFSLCDNGGNHLWYLWAPKLPYDIFSCSRNERKSSKGWKVLWAR